MTGPDPIPPLQSAAPSLDPTGRIRWLARLKIPRALKWVFGLWLLAMVALTPVWLHLFRMYRDAGAAFEAYSHAVVAKQFDVAYDSASGAFKQANDRDKFTRLHADLAQKFGRLKAIKRSFGFEVRSSAVDGSTARFAATYIYERASLDATLSFRLIVDRWQIDGLDIRY